jgi:MGT family glycosyltransferase
VHTLLTVGAGFDPSALGPLPENLHVEPWVAQEQVLAHAHAVVCHGGSGTMLGALGWGLPLVVMPLFADQPHNARRVQAVGAGLRVEPSPGSAPELRDAIERVIEQDHFRVAASNLAQEMGRHEPMQGAVRRMERLCAG